MIRREIYAGNIVVDGGGHEDGLYFTIPREDDMTDQDWYKSWSWIHVSQVKRNSPFRGPLIIRFLKDSPLVLQDGDEWSPPL